MARRQNPKRQNQNKIFLGCSGSGKSQALRQALSGRRGDRVVLWDLDRDHTGRHFETLGEFRRALVDAVKGGGGFRIAYSGDAESGEFLVWCRLVWALLDGAVITYVVVEELADASRRISGEVPEFGRILRRGRKYGAVCLLTNQRAAETSKTAVTQCSERWVGQQRGDDVGAAARLLGVSSEDVLSLSSLEFYVMSADGVVRRERVAYKGTG